MRKRISLSLILCLCLLLFTCSTVLAADNTCVVPGLGTITFPEDVEILPAQQIIDNFPSNILLAKDNEIWRSITILFVPTIDREALKQAEKLEPTFNELSTKLVNDYNSMLLYNGPINKQAVKNERIALKSFKFLFLGMVVNMDFYIVQGNNGGVGIATIYLDCDNEYWNPRVTKMIADIKRVGAK